MARFRGSDYKWKWDSTTHGGNGQRANAASPSANRQARHARRRSGPPAKPNFFRTTRHLSRARLLYGCGARLGRASLPPLCALALPPSAAQRSQCACTARSEAPEAPCTESTPPVSPFLRPHPERKSSSRRGVFQWIASATASRADIAPRAPVTSFKPPPFARFRSVARFRSFS